MAKTHQSEVINGKEFLLDPHLRASIHKLLQETLDQGLSEIAVHCEGPDRQPVLVQRLILPMPSLTEAVSRLQEAFMGLLARHGQFLPPWNPCVVQCCVCRSSWESESREHIYSVEAQKGGMKYIKNTAAYFYSTEKEGSGLLAWLPACLSQTLH